MSSKTWFISFGTLLATILLVIGINQSEERGVAGWYEDPLRGIGYPKALGIDNNHRPAGKFGFVQRRGGDLIFEDGTPVKFWGVNIQAYAITNTDKATARQHAHRLAKLGINLVRIHHFDSSWVHPNIFGLNPINTKKINSKVLDAMDWWIKCLKDEGIYVWIDLHVERQFTDKDGIRNFLDASKGASRADLKGFNYVNGDVANAMSSFSRRLLLHKNPYTGQKYINDPAIAVVLLTNENDLSHHFGNALLKDKGVPAHHKSFKEAAQKASLELGLDPQRVLKTWEMGDSKIFLNHLEYQFNQRMISDLRAIGYKSLIVTTSSWGGMGISGLPSLTSGDMIDVHRYSTGNELSIDPVREAGIQHWISAAQVTDMPLSVSEWNASGFPDPTRYQLPTLLASLGSLQGWDIMILYGYAQDSLNRPIVGDNWNAYMDPTLMALMPAASLIFRNSHVDNARRHQKLRLSESDFFEQKIDATSSMSIRTVSEKSKLTIDVDFHEKLPWLSSKHEDSVTPQEIVGCNGEIISEPDLNCINGDDSRIISDNGQIKRDWAAGVQVVNTGKSIVFSGDLPENKVLHAGPVTIKLNGTPVAVVVQSLNDSAIINSEKILITIMGNSVAPSRAGIPYRIYMPGGEVSLALNNVYQLTASCNCLDSSALDVSDNYIHTLRLDSSMRSPWIILEKNHKS